MTVVRRFLFLIILIHVFCVSKGQINVVYQTEEKADLPVSFIKTPEGPQVNTNYFIGEIARCAQKKIEFTQYNYNFNKVYRIIEESANHYIATIEFTDFTCKGDAFYRGFSINEALIPNFCSMHVQIYGIQSTPLINQDIVAAPLQSGYNKAASFSFTDTCKLKKYKIEVSNLKFEFDNNSIERFTAKLKQIDDYFLSGPLIESYMQQLRTIDFGNTDMIIVYDIKLKDVEKAFEKLYQMDFPGKLKLSDNDPVKLIDKINSFSDSLFLLRKQMNDKISNLDKIYYQKGIQSLQKGDIAKAQTSFNSSALYNPNFAPTQFELAKLWYRRDSLFNTSNVITHILQKLNPDGVLQKQVLLFADTVYNKMISVGQEYVRVEKFNEAIELFEHCIKFCSDLPGYNCADKQVKGLASAKFGIYQSYLSVSQRAMENGKLDLAEIYIQEAMKYQKLNPADIISNAEAKLKLEKLLSVYITKSDTLNAQHNFSKALFFLEKVRKVSDSNQLVLPVAYLNSVSKAKNGIYKSLIKKSQEQLLSGQEHLSEQTLNEAVDFQSKNEKEVAVSYAVDTLFVKIKTVAYKDNIHQGMMYCSIQEYPLALRYFDEAKSLEQKFYLKKDKKLDSLIKVTGKPIIMAKLQSVESFINLLQIDSANAAMNSIHKSQALHLLNNDNEINAKAAELTERIFSTKCVQQKSRFDSIYTAANYNIIRQNFLLADEQLAVGINISEKYPECHIDADKAMSDKKMVQKNAAYQKLMQKSQQAYQSKNYADYFYYYNEGENYYLQNQLINTGMIHPGLVDMISVSNDTLFILKSFDYLASKNKYEDALVCLKTLEKISYPQKSSKGIQQQLAVKMAMRDFKQNPKGNPTLMTLNYMADSKWLKYFKSAYLMTWRTSR